MVFLFTQPTAFPLTENIAELLTRTMVNILAFCTPSLRTTYLAFDNSLRLALQALGIKSKKAEGIMELGKYVEEKYGKSEESKQKVKV